jgi:hypothetical protein
MSCEQIPLTTNPANKQAKAWKGRDFNRKKHFNRLVPTTLTASLCGRIRPQIFEWEEGFASIG